MFMSVKPEKNKWELREFVSCPSPSQQGEERWEQWPGQKHLPLDSSMFKSVSLDSLISLLQVHSP